MRILTCLVTTCVCSLLFYAAPSMAFPSPPGKKQYNSGSLRPAQNTATKVYESYISNEGCKNVDSSSPVFTGAASLYLASGNDPISGKPMQLQCEENYVMVDMHSETSGFFVAPAGGQVNNNSTVKCCPIKYRWSVPKASA